MRSPQAVPPPLAPRALVEQLAGRLADLAVHGALGLLIGVLVARALRARRLHWSWAAWALAPALLAHALLDGWLAMLALAGISAAVWGRRWHREDLDAGMQPARIASRRPGPGTIVARVLRGLARHGRIARALGNEGWFRRGELILGRDERGRDVSIPFGGCGGGRHTLVLGATGSGKTVTQTWMAVRAIERGMGALVIDPKGDPVMRAELARAAHLHARALHVWTPQGACVYNPYARGGDSEIADKALAGERFTEPHYLRQAQRYLGHVVRALRAGGGEVSLRAMVEALEPAQLELLLRQLPERDVQATHRYLDSLSTRQRSDLAGVRDRLAILAESDVGPWLDPGTRGSERLDLLEAVRSRAVVYFDLQADSRPLLAQMLGAAIVQDLQTIVATLQGRPEASLVVIDEFSAVAAEQVVRLFGRARSAGFSLLLGTQEISDLRPPGRERLLEQVIGNLSVLVAHRQVVPASAELIAGIAGRRSTWRVSRHSNGSSTRTASREAVLDADEILRLGQGWAAVIVPGRGEVRLTRVCSPRGGR